MKKSVLKSLIEQIVKETVVKKLDEGQPVGGVKNDHPFDDGRYNVMKAVNVAENNNERPCECGSGLPSEWEYDGQGIPLCRACPKCRQKKLSKYRPEILRHYTQADVDEPIEPEYNDGMNEKSLKEFFESFKSKNKSNIDFKFVERLIKQSMEAANNNKVKAIEILKKALQKVDPNLKDIYTLAIHYINQGQGQKYAQQSAERDIDFKGESIGFDGKYVDDMESGTAVKKLHNLDEAKTGNKIKEILRNFSRMLIFNLKVRDKAAYQVAEKTIDDFLKAHSNELEEESGTGAVGGYSTPFAFKKKKNVKENEFDGRKLPKHNAKVSPQELQQATTIAKQIWGNELKNITFHSKSLNGRTKYFKVDINSTYFRWLSQNEQGQWNYTDDGGIRSKWVPFTGHVNEMSASGDAGGYQTPYSFSKNKDGSKRAIDATKKLGFKVVKSISEDTK